MKFKARKPQEETDRALPLGAELVSDRQYSLLTTPPVSHRREKELWGLSILSFVIPFLPLWVLYQLELVRREVVGKGFAPGEELTRSRTLALAALALHSVIVLYFLLR